VAVGDIGFVYNYPTQRGSFIFGAGYTQTVDFNRAFSLNTRNDVNSITDSFLTTGDGNLFDTAFDGYAIDYDEDADEYFSVLRVFPEDPFRGITQRATILERGQLGEMGFFFATEFQENFFV